MVAPLVGVLLAFAVGLMATAVRLDRDRAFFSLRFWQGRSSWTGLSSSRVF
jgi:hypothetical protein